VPVKTIQYDYDATYPTALRRMLPQTGTVPLDSFKASATDTFDGLGRQYRLPVSFPALPPGVVEEVTLRMKLEPPARGPSTISGFVYI